MDQENIKELLRFIGEDPEREGLKETPARVLKSWKELTSGYRQEPKDFLTVFEKGTYNQIVLLQDIEMYSTCVAGSTFVETPKGRIPISRLKDKEWIYCWDEDNCRMTLTQARNPRITGINKQLWRVYSDKDTVLCTGDHKFLTTNGKWVKAKDLRTGDSVIALNKNAMEQNDELRVFLTIGYHDYISEHRFVFEEVYGKINSKVHIHHIDGNPNNNSPDNLNSVSPGEHARLHRLQENGKTGFAIFTEEQRQKMKVKRIQGIKNSQTPEVKEKRAKSLRQYWSSLSTKERRQRNHKILSIEKTNWFEDVWCMDVPVFNNFIANGMVVHNCEHHMLPFFGKAHVAYLPGEHVIGISKLARLVDLYARRLQIQERIGEQVTEALMTYLKCQGAACFIEAKHMCMSSRGCNKQNSMMKTSSLKGVFLEDPSFETKLLTMIK